MAVWKSFFTMSVWESARLDNPCCSGVVGMASGSGRLQVTIESIMTALLWKVPKEQWSWSALPMLGSEGMLKSTCK